MSGPLIRFLSGAHFTTTVDITKDGSPVAVSAGATVKALLRDEGTALTVAVTCNSGANGADWPNGRIVASFTSQETAAIPFESETNERSASLELMVNDTEETRWLQDGYLVIKGLI